MRPKAFDELGNIGWLPLRLGICASAEEGCQWLRLALSTIRHDGRGPDGSLKKLLIFIYSAVYTAYGISFAISMLWAVVPLNCIGATLIPSNWHQSQTIPKSYRGCYPPPKTARIIFGDIYLVLFASISLSPCIGTRAPNRITMWSYSDAQIILTAASN